MSTMSTAGHWEPMTSPQLENAQLFQLAEGHQAVILHPAAPFERFLMINAFHDYGVSKKLLQ